MNFQFVPMTDEQAREIAGWKYEGTYAFYDMDTYPEDVANLLDPARRKDRMFSALDGAGSLAGFFEFTRDGDAIEVGLGLRPSLTGLGLGLSFVRAGLQFSRESHAPSRFRLRVWAANERAIRVYERAGFKHVRRYVQKTGRGEFPFMEMGRLA